MAKSFDAELAGLDALAAIRLPLLSIRSAEPSPTKNNFIVAKAAKLAVEHDHRSLVPELVAAFHHFLDDGAKRDPQCWAKNACIKALSDFEHQDEALFLAGISTIQLEAVWGGTSDTAGTLRSLSAMALVQCRGLSNVQVLTHLLPLFADKESPVRVNAARAVEQVGTEASLLLLRLRAELASDGPELLGACYSGVLHLEGPGAIPWAAKFLNPLHPDDASSEAAFAIADTRSELAFTTLHAAWKQSRDPDFRGTLLTAIALTRQDKAYDFLLDQVADGSPAAREALENSAPSTEILARLNPL